MLLRIKNDEIMLYLYTCSMVWYSTHRVFDKLIWCTIGPKSFLFGTAQFSLRASGTVNYDYVVIISYSRCIPNRTFTNHCWANLAHVSTLIKNCEYTVFQLAKLQLSGTDASKHICDLIAFLWPHQREMALHRAVQYLSSTLYVEPWHTYVYR